MTFRRLHQMNEIHQLKISGNLDGQAQDNCSGCHRNMARRDQDQSSRKGLDTP